VSRDNGLKTTVAPAQVYNYIPWLAVLFQCRKKTAVRDEATTAMDKENYCSPIKISTDQERRVSVTESFGSFKSVMSLA
jgi:hypothetical protein